MTTTVAVARTERPHRFWASTPITAALALCALGVSACAVDPLAPSYTAEQRFAVEDGDGGVVGSLIRTCRLNSGSELCSEQLRVTVRADGVVRSQRVEWQVERRGPSTRWRTVTVDDASRDEPPWPAWAALAGDARTPLEAALESLGSSALHRTHTVIGADGVGTGWVRAFCARARSDATCVLVGPRTRVVATSVGGPRITLERGLALRLLPSGTDLPANDPEAEVLLWERLRPGDADNGGDPVAEHRAGFVVSGGPVRWPDVARQRVTPVDGDTVRVDILREPPSHDAVALARWLSGQLPSLGPNTGRVGGDLADCTEVATVSQRLLAERGRAARVVVGAVPAARQRGWVWHAWVVVTLDGHEVSMDPGSGRSPVPATWLAVAEPSALDGVELDALVGRLRLQATPWIGPQPSSTPLPTEPR